MIKKYFSSKLYLLALCLGLSALAFLSGPAPAAAAPASWLSPTNGATYNIGDWIDFSWSNVSSTNYIRFAFPGQGWGDWIYRGSNQYQWLYTGTFSPGTIWALVATLGPGSQWQYSSYRSVNVQNPPVYACGDGGDNDGDGLTDYPSDPGCSSSGDNDEYNAPALSDDHGDSCAAGTSMTPIDYVDGLINPAGDWDYFGVAVSGSGTLTAETSGNTDTYGYLLGSDCGNLTADDDSGPGTNFRITRSVSAGTYYIAVKHYSPNGTGSYTLNTSFVNPPQAPSLPTNLRFSPTAPVKGNTVTAQWDVSPSATYYLVAFYPNLSWDGGQDRNTTTNSLVYPSSTSNLNSLGFQVRACRQGGLCSGWTGLGTVNFQAPTPANTSPGEINTTTGSNSTGYQGNLSNSSDVQYVRVLTNAADQVYRVQTWGGITPTIALVDLNGNTITPTANTDIQISAGAAIFKVPANLVYYVKFTGAVGGYNYYFQRYRSVPYFQGQ